MSEPSALFDSSKNASQDSFRDAVKYIGLALMLAWHYTLWFIPNIFSATELMANNVTYSWLIMLGASVCALFAIPLLCGRKRYLSSQRWLLWGVPIILCLGTLYLTLVGFRLDAPPLGAYVVAAILGFGSAIYWILWGELYARRKMPFSILHVGPIVAISLLVSLILATLLPSPFSSLWAALLPLISGYALIKISRSNKTLASPRLLPASTTKEGIKSMIVICLISFAASLSCYFLVAIIPWEALYFHDHSFTLGVMGGAVFMLIIAAISKIFPQKDSVFQIFPLLLVLIVVAYALFLADEFFYLEAFIITLAISSMMEILLAMYFGILTAKGYVAPALAFGLSGGSIRAGILAGNGWALYYENHLALAEAVTPETALFLMCLLAALLIPLVRKEYSIIKLTSDPPRESDLSVRCIAVAQEFSLSPRESEIMTLLARGYTADAIAQKLVISPHTVNTHIRHTYEKMSIHKRSELLNYINLHTTDY